MESDTRMLIGLPPILGPDLLYALRSMGHGDEIALVDGNYPAQDHARRLVRADGHGVIALIEAILAVMPLDTAVSAAIFLYSPDTILAAVAVLNMDDAGNVGGAAAMSTLILFTSASVSLLLAWASRGALRRSQAWRLRAPGR